MASIGHIAVGMAAGRLFVPKDASRAQVIKAMVAFSALSMAPDLDVIGFRFGVSYDNPYGHRGATHSLGAALLIGALTWLFSPRFGLPRARVTVFAFLVVVSHMLLDTLTTGGLGAELLWPFWYERYFFVWRPIPVAPIGFSMFSGRGVYVVLVETVMFSPLFFYALFPRLRPKRAEALPPESAPR